MSREFGNYVRRLRGKETRKAVADRAGFSAEYLRRIEEEGRVPHKDKQLSLARALNADERRFLDQALRAENRLAHHLLTTPQPTYPNLRRVLVDRLTGVGRATVLSDIENLPLSLPERSAIILWTAALMMDREELEPQAAVDRARELITDNDFVNNQVAEYVVRHLVSWNVDPETGRQTHAADTPETGDLLGQAAETLGLASSAVGGSDMATALEIADLLRDSEFADLFYKMKGYLELNERDRAEIRSLWELAGQMVRDRLARKPEPTD